jgi:hemerythrin-like domain-containing protein
MKITDILLAEHFVFHNLFDSIEAGAGRLRTVAAVRAQAALLESMLKPHSQMEHELLMDPLDHCLDQLGHRDTFHHEHEAIEHALAAARKARDLVSARRLLLEAVLASRKHFDKEERVVFPLAERLLKSKTLLELGARWMQQRQGTAR